jgi:hypothetical protein
MQELTVDEAKIKKAVQSGIPLTITTYTLPHEIEMYIEKAVTVFLKQIDKEDLKDYVIYCVQELAVNAKKANTKRIYFMEQGLDLTNPHDYREGMASFKAETLTDIGHYLQRQKEKGLYVKLILQIKNNTINIEVRNNVTITKIELNRIREKLAWSRRYENLEDALGQVLDDSEGAGLGLVIMVLILKKIGLAEDSFGIATNGRETIAHIRIPLDKVLVESFGIDTKNRIDSLLARFSAGFEKEIDG